MLILQSRYAHVVFAASAEATNGWIFVSAHMRIFVRNKGERQEVIMHVSERNGPTHNLNTEATKRKEERAKLEMTTELSSVQRNYKAVCP